MQRKWKIKLLSISKSFIFSMFTFCRNKLAKFDNNEENRLLRFLIIWMSFGCENRVFSIYHWQDPSPPNFSQLRVLFHHFRSPRHSFYRKISWFFRYPNISCRFGFWIHNFQRAVSWNFIDFCFDDRTWRKLQLH